VEGSDEQYAPRKITILEALSATGLRSIRYAKEIPNVRTVLANDISHSACEAMRMNVDYNDAGPSAPVEAAADSTEAGEPVVPAAELSPEEQAMNFEEGVKGSGEPSRRRPGCDGYVTVNENDAWYAMSFTLFEVADRQHVDVRTSSSGQAS
jgi:tRNA (guanine26-N2/guanine27-N2)-dimethyltransferase